MSTTFVSRTCQNDPRFGTHPHWTIHKHSRRSWNSPTSACWDIPISGWPTWLPSWLRRCTLAALLGRNVLRLNRTGAGKTWLFCFPMLVANALLSTIYGLGPLRYLGIRFIVPFAANHTFSRMRACSCAGTFSKIVSTSVVDLTSVWPSRNLPRARTDGWTLFVR